MGQRGAQRRGARPPTPSPHKGSRPGPPATTAPSEPPTKRAAYPFRQRRSYGVSQKSVVAENRAVGATSEYLPPPRALGSTRINVLVVTEAPLIWRYATARGRLSGGRQAPPLFAALCLPVVNRWFTYRAQGHGACLAGEANFAFPSMPSGGK